MAGVRFEKPVIPQPPKANASYYETGIITSPNINFAPRVAIAYRINDKSVLRAGYSWYYEPMPGSLFDALYYMGNANHLVDFTSMPEPGQLAVFPQGVHHHRQRSFGDDRPGLFEPTSCAIPPCAS